MIDDQLFEKAVEHNFNYNLANRGMKKILKSIDALKKDKKLCIPGDHSDEK